MFVFIGLIKLFELTTNFFLRAKKMTNAATNSTLSSSRVVLLFALFTNTAVGGSGEP